MSTREENYKMVSLTKLCLTGLLVVFFMLLFTWQHAAALNLTQDDCRYCHGKNMSARHHLLLGLTSYVCFSCHLLGWDPVLNAYTYNSTGNCMSCHTASLADRHHIFSHHADVECLSCHAVYWDSVNQSFYLDFDYVTAKKQSTHYFYHIMEPNDCSGCHLTNISDEHDKNCDLCHDATDPIVRAAVYSGNKDCSACHGSADLSNHLMNCGICHSPTPTITSDIKLLHQQHMQRVNCGYCHLVADKYNLEETDQQCVVCHSSPRPYTISDVPDLHRVHLIGRGYFPYTCYMCHGKAVPQKQPDQCGVCHGDSRYYDSAELQSTHRIHNLIFDCTNCHFNPMDFMAYDPATACERCHEVRSYTSKLSLHGFHNDRPCWTCHPADYLINQRQLSMGCNCHSARPAYPNAQYVHWNHNGYQCWVCHDAIYPSSPTTTQPLNFSSGSIAGMVTDENLAPMNAIKIYTQDGLYLTQSREGGNYSLYHLAPGYYTISAEKEGYVTQTGQVSIKDGQTANLDFTLPVAIPTTADISGKVADVNNNPLSGAKIKTADKRYKTVTASDGAYFISSLDPGSYSVIVSKGGFFEETGTITVVAGQTGTLDFVLDPIPNQFLCTTCHVDLGSKVNCNNKKWKNHLKRNLVLRANYEEAETTFLGQICSSGGSSEMRAATAPTPEQSPANGDLASCPECHGDLSSKVSCSNKKWRVHYRKRKIDRATYDLAEITFLGDTCNLGL